MEDPQKVLELTVQAGQLLLENGAEVFRVQQTMEIMAAAYGETEFHVYVLTNGIFASLGRDGRQHMARVGHVPQSSVHLGRVDAVNTLSRQIAAGQVPLEEAIARIKQIRAIPVLPLWQQVLACAAGTGFFAILFGGGWREFGCAFVAGILLQLFLWQAEGRRLNKIITRLLGAALVTAVAVLGVWLGFSRDVDRIIIGSIMPLVPGIALTMAVRDFFNSDYLSGTIRIMDALIIGLSIAAGVGVVLAFGAVALGVSL